MLSCSTGQWQSQTQLPVLTLGTAPASVVQASRHWRSWLQPYQPPSQGALWPATLTSLLLPPSCLQVDAIDYKTRTALCLAAIYGSTDCVYLLAQVSWLPGWMAAVGAGCSS